MAKKYFWLKLKDDFFRDKRIKKLRRIAGGDTFTLIYLKMQLLSLKNEGILIYEQVEDTFYEEVALEIDEDIDNVKVTVMFLMSNGLLEEVDENKFALIETMNSIGSESQAAERVRKHREIKKNEQKALQCNTTVTTCNTEIEKEKEKEKDLDLKKENKKTLRHKYETCDMENAQLLFSLMLENNPNTSKPNLESWANTFRLLREKTDYTDEQVKYVIKWCQNDSFWKTNILSASKFREKMNQLVLRIKSDNEKSNKPQQQYQKPINPWEEYLYEQAGSGSFNDHDKRGISDGPKLIKQRFDI